MNKMKHDFILLRPEAAARAVRPHILARWHDPGLGEEDHTTFGAELG